MVVKMKRPTPAVNIRLSPTTIYCICINCQAPVCVCQPTYLRIVLYLSIVRSLTVWKIFFDLHWKYFLSRSTTTLRCYDGESGSMVTTTREYHLDWSLQGGCQWSTVHTVHHHHCTHCTPGKVHSVCAQILQFCNVTVFIWFCVGTWSHTIKYVSSSNFYWTSAR